MFDYEKIYSVKVWEVDYTRKGIESIRNELIMARNESMEQWPEAIAVTLLLSHTIALLARLFELTKD